MVCSLFHHHNRCRLILDFSLDKSGQICTIRPHPNFRAFMAMNNASGEVSQPMRNRGIEISIHSNEFTRADAVQVALASGVSVHDTNNLLPTDCSLRRAKFVAETACALGGAGCSMEETIQLIGELNFQPSLIAPIVMPLGDAVDTCQLQQPSLHAWLNHPNQAKFLRSCCSVATISRLMSAALEGDMSSSSIKTSPPSLLAAACAFSLFASAKDYEDIGRMLSVFPPNSFLELVSAGVAHLHDQNFKDSDNSGSFDVLLGYLCVCATGSCSSNVAVGNCSSKCNAATLHMWFGVVLLIDGIYLQRQGDACVCCCVSGVLSQLI